LRRQHGKHALVDSIPFAMPVSAEQSRAFMAVFTVDAAKVAKLLPGRELHPYRLWNRGLLLVTVIDYRNTSIGKYIEFSLGVACTHGRRPAPRLLPALLPGRYGFGQYVLDLPVSSEISVKGGKGIWGMPKHRASLDFLVDSERISSQYDLDGRLAVRIDIAPPRRRLIRWGLPATNYSAFRGLLMKSSVHLTGRPRVSLFGGASARLEIGDDVRVAGLKELEIAEHPIATVFYPQFAGVLDDHLESWMLTYDHPVEAVPEGFESVIDLGLGEEWPDPPDRRD
jgi:hypothetical protein